MRLPGIVLPCSLLLPPTLVCGATQTPKTPTKAATAGKEVALRIGEARVTSDGLHLKVQGVPEDSRCPVDVTCVWAGNAKVRVEAHKPPAAPVALDLNTGYGPQRQEAVYGAFLVRLVSVAPPRRAKVGPLKPDDYVIHLRVTPKDRSSAK